MTRAVCAGTSGRRQWWRLRVPWSIFAGMRISSPQVLQPGGSGPAPYPRPSRVQLWGGAARGL